MANTKTSKTNGKQESAKSNAKSKTNRKTDTSKNNTSARQQSSARSKTSVVILVALVIALVLEISNLNLLGQVGGFIQSAQFGLFGIMAYVFPVAGFLFVLYINFSRKKSIKNMVCYIILFFCLCALTHLISGLPVSKDTFSAVWEKCAKDLTGGGVAGGAIATALGTFAGRAGAYIIIILAVLICILFITEYPIADKIGEAVRRRRENRSYYEEEPDDGYYQYEYEDYEEPRQSRKKKEYDSREAVLSDEEPRVHTRTPGKLAPRAYAGSFRNTFRKSEDADLPENNRRAKVYEGTDEDGNYIKIVHVPSKKKSKETPRADLNRTNKKSHTVRETTAPRRLTRSHNKTRGLGEGLEMYALNANGDEVHEITDPKAKDRRYAVEEAEARLQGEQEIQETEDWVGEDVFADKEPKPVANETKEEKPQPARPQPRAAVSGMTFSDPPVRKESTAPAVTGTAKAVPVKTKKKSGKEEYHYPPLDLLEKRKRTVNSGNDDLEKVSRNLELILSTYGVNAKVVNAQEGPSVTRYELQPELGTRVSRITSLADDLKLNLAVPDIRIEAPIPGRAAVGIEVPNKTKDTVYMRELLEEPTLISHPSKIAYAAGKDISGNVVVSDIAQMPHLLVAGTTGSGKSIFVNTILMTILYRAKPSEVGLIIIDPKKVEFGVYSGIPHLVQDVVTDPGQAVSTLRWAVVEMTNRYQRMQLSGVRDFKSYNAKFDKGQLNPEEENPKRMPQIVIVIDELADLMMVASKETESLICRLAQLARAAGIHLIIATQRPSVDVVTGLIKANIPARVALLVASGTDSRTIIDSNGAEKLLGKGDMLFYPTGYVKPVRVQGAFVSEKEVYDTIRYIKEHNDCDYYADEAEEIENYMSSSGASATGIPGLTAEDHSGSDNKYDEYFKEAGQLCIETGKASSSMIQRRFSIGFNRAARIIDQLEEVGAIGPQNGAKPREILMDEMQFEEVCSTLNGS